MHTKRTLTAAIGVGALVLPLFVVAHGDVVQASPGGPRTWYVAQSGTASFGSGTSCAAPDVVGSDDTAVRTALAAAMNDDTVAICDGVYTITRTLNIDDSIAIQGQSTQGTVLDGGGVAQIMRLEDSAIDDTTGVPEVSVVIQDLTFRNGSTGPNGTDACNTQSQCGGAIYAEDESNLIVRRSYFLNNSASFIGGAIAMHGEANYTGGDIRIYDSTFESNTSDIDGGGIGVAFNFSPGLTVVNSTFVDNHAVGRAGGAIGQAFADGTISSSTFVNNQAPASTALAGPFTVTGSLFAQGPGIPGDICNAGTFSYSVATTADCGTSTVVTYSSLKLRGLGSWGGPTPTVWFGPDSSAVNANTGACLGVDQRGANRSASPCDAGAYERQGPTDESTAGTLTYPTQVLATDSVSPLTHPSFGGSGRTTGFMSLTSDICTLDETTGLVTGVAQGTCIAQWYLKPTLTLDGAASDDTLAVVKSAQAPLLIVPPGPVVYGVYTSISTTGGSGVGAVSLSEGLSTGCFAWISVVYVTDVSGTCVITATKDSDATYDGVTSAPLTLQMVKAEQEPLTIQAPSSLANGSAAILSTSGGSSGGMVTYSAGPGDVCEVTGSVLRMLTSLGTCRVGAIMAGDTNFHSVGANSVDVAATLPAPPDATLVPSAPTNVMASQGRTGITVSWQPPSYAGAFPISHYLVDSSPKGGTCLVPASQITCAVSGLRSGRAYSFTVQALNGIGWSVPSSPVKTEGLSSASITIVGSRSGAQIFIAGTATGGGIGNELTPWISKGGRTYTRGRAAIVATDGSFTWSRKANAQSVWRVYMTSGDVRSNTVTIR